MTSRCQFLFLFACAIVSPAAAQTMPLTNKDVVTLVEGGLADNVIISAIQAQDTDLDISASSLIALKRKGVPSKVIDTMIAVTSKHQRVRQALASGPSSGREKQLSENKDLPIAPSADAGCQHYALRLGISGNSLTKEYKYQQQASFTMPDAQLPLTIDSNGAFRGQGEGTVAATGSTVTDDSRCAGSSTIPLAFSATGTLISGVSPLLRGHIKVLPGTASSSSSCGSMKYQAGPPTGADFELPAIVGTSRIVNLPVQEASLPLKIGLVRLDHEPAAETSSAGSQDNSFVRADAATCAASPGR